MNDEDLEDVTNEAALYALGALPAEKTSAVEQRLRSGCGFCAAQVERYAAVAEHLALSVRPVAPRAELRQRLIDRIERRGQTVPPSEHMQIVRGTEAPWIQMPFPGVAMRRLIGDKTLMVRMQPGAVFPRHDHPAAEQCYVLEGSLTDSDGVTVYAGDFVVVSKGITHEQLHSETGCTLFVAYAD
jgi:mannose-6-phosphate isomerase-like protein (cupin superfamily)